ncbi:MAG: hypothetical protein ACOZAN_04045 [Patescibacteria group bacterium]
MSEKIIPAVITALGIIASVTVLSVIAFLGVNNYLKVEQQKARYQAVHDCLVASKIETHHKSTDREAVTTEPIKDVYTYCLTDKGLIQQ